MKPGYCWNRDWPKISLLHPAHISYFPVTLLEDAFWGHTLLQCQWLILTKQGRAGPAQGILQSLPLIKVKRHTICAQLKYIRIYKVKVFLRSLIWRYAFRRGMHKWVKEKGHYLAGLHCEPPVLDPRKSIWGVLKMYLYRKGSSEEWKVKMITTFLSSLIKGGNIE